MWFIIIGKSYLKDAMIHTCKRSKDNESKLSSEHLLCLYYWIRSSSSSCKEISIIILFEMRRHVYNIQLFYKYIQRWHKILILLLFVFFYRKIRIYIWCWWRWQTQYLIKILNFHFVSSLTIHNIQMKKYH